MKRWKKQPETWYEMPEYPEYQINNKGAIRMMTDTGWCKMQGGNKKAEPEIYLRQGNRIVREYKKELMERYILPEGVLV
jgi:hypothetical protein